MAITATANTRVTVSRCSPSSGTANSRLKKGWMSWIWLTRTAPSARARYHAKKPIHIENSATYRKPAQLIAPMLEGAAGANHQATGRVSGRQHTSTQQMTCSAPSRGVRRAPPM